MRAMPPALTAALVGALLTLGLANRPPDPTTPSADTTRPTGTVTVAAPARLWVLLEGLPARLRCSEAATATAALNVGARTAKRLGLTRRNGIATGRACCGRRRGTVTVRPAGEIAARLARGRGSWKATLAVTLVDAAGNTGRTSTRVTITPSAGEGARSARG